MAGAAKGGPACRIKVNSDPHLCPSRTFTRVGAPPLPGPEPAGPTRAGAPLDGGETEPGLRAKVAGPPLPLDK